MREGRAPSVRRLFTFDLVLTAVFAVAAVAVLLLVKAHDPSDRSTEQVSIPRCPASETAVGNTIVDLAKAGNECRAKAVLRRWSAAELEEERAGVTLDYALIALYIVTIGSACLQGRRRIRFSLGATLLTGAQVLAGAADAVENHFLKQMMHGDVTQVAARGATICFNFKTPIILTGIGFGLSVLVARVLALRKHDGAWANGPPVWETPLVPAALELENVTARKKVLNWLLGVQTEPLLRPPVRAVPVPGRMGICCSGGGIRSAAYNLGALQALNAANEYQNAEYVSAVSGGSYIAAAYAIAGSDTDEEVFRPGSPEEQYLRNHSSYLAPGVAGKLSFAWRVLRGLAVNLSLIALVLTAFGLAGGWAVMTRMKPSGAPDGSVFTLAGRAVVTMGDGASIEHPDLGRLALDEGSVISIPRFRVVLGRGALIRVAKSSDPGREVAPQVQEAVGDVPEPLVLKNTQSEVASAQRVRLDNAKARLSLGESVRLRSGRRLDTPKGTILRTGVDAAVQSPGGTPAFLKVSRTSVVTDEGFVIERCRGGPCVDHAVPSWVIGILIGLGVAGIGLGLIDVVVRPPSSLARLLESWSMRLVVSAVAWAVLAIGLPEVIEMLLRNRRFPLLDIGGVSGGGVAAIVSGVIADLTGGRAKEAELGVEGRVKAAARKLASRLGPRLRSAFVSLMGGLVGPLLLIASLVLLITQGAKEGPTNGQLAVWFWSVIGFLLLWSCGDLIQWSVYPLYKRRLWSAFVLRRYTDAAGIPRAIEAPDYDRPLRLGSLPLRRPHLVVCAAANVSTRGVAPPGRPVSAYTFERDAVGGGLFGTLRPEELEALAEGEYASYVTVPSAFAISGAAVSPAMGKMTKRRFTSLLALANVRLGVWLPNPLQVRLLQAKAAAVHRRVIWKAARREFGRGRSFEVTPETRGDAGEVFYRTPGSAAVEEAARRKEERVRRNEWMRHYVVRPHYLLMELLGWNSYRRHFIYVTDGGHFENLGLVELLRRGCTEIYCFDASGGDVDTYATLGEAVALARSELGVDIDIRPEKMSRPPGGDYCANDHVVGKITYQSQHAVIGHLVFSRAAVIADAPWDVRAYQQKDPDFPTHSTLDQLYTDEKFEAYRKLGNSTAERAITAMRATRRQSP